MSNELSPTALLHRAIENGGELYRVKSLLQSGTVDVNSKTRRGETCLHLAIKQGNVGRIELVMAELNARNNIRSYASQYMSMKQNIAGKCDIITSLLNSGADIEARDNAGNTPLHAAVKQNSVFFAELLLRRGADPNARNARGNTAFHESFQLENENLSLLFLDYGVELHLKDREGKNALHLAVESSSLLVIERLVGSMGKVNEATDRGDTALHLLMRRARIKDSVKLAVAKTLVENGAHVNATNDSSITPLGCGSNSRDDQVMQYLLSRDAYVLDGQGSQLYVYRAMRSRDKPTVERFVHRFVENASHSELMFKALCISDSTLREDIVQFLLENGENANERSDLAEGSSLLHYVVARNDLWMFELLIKKGANVHARDNAGHSALFIAAREGFHDAAEVLLRKKASVRGVLGEAVRNGDSKMATILLDNGADPNDPEAWRMLGKWGSGSMLTLLEARGGVYAPRSDAGHEVFLDAIDAARADLLELLLDRGADVNRRWLGVLPLQRSIGTDANGSNHPNFSIVKLLVKRVALLEMQGVQVQEDNLRAIRSKRLILAEYETYVAELKRAKNTRIVADLNVTYFDLLTSSKNALIGYLRYKQLCWLLDMKDCKTTLPNYGENLEHRYLQALMRFWKISKFEDVLKRVFGDMLPNCAVRLIAEFYNDRDFKRCFEE